MGGEKDKMKTIYAISLMAILATGVIVPALQDAYALNSNTSEKLSPKAYGLQTKTKMVNVENKTYKDEFREIKLTPTPTIDSVKKVAVPKALKKAYIYDDIGPKAYGTKTMGKMVIDDALTHMKGFEGMKKELVKNFKKYIAAITATETLKQLYRLG